MMTREENRDRRVLSSSLLSQESLLCVHAISNSNKLYFCAVYVVQSRVGIQISCAVILIERVWSRNKQKGPFYGSILFFTSKEEKKSNCMLVVLPLSLALLLARSPLLRAIKTKKFLLGKKPDLRNHQKRLPLSQRFYKMSDTQLSY